VPDREGRVLQLYPPAVLVLRSGPALAARFHPWTSAIMPRAATAAAVSSPG
jgi:hypothetical protein